MTGKFETRNSKQTRSSKFKTIHLGAPASRRPVHRTLDFQLPISGFEFRASNFGFHSSFVIRHALGASFFSTFAGSSDTYFGRPPSIGGRTSPSINGLAYSTNFSFGKKPSSLTQSRGTKCSTLAMSLNGCKPVVQRSDPLPP